MQTKNGEWWDYSWNFVPGCTKLSPECSNCWALAMAKRLQGMKKPGYEGLVDDKGRWSGRVNLLEGRLQDPMQLQRPRTIAVNLMGDLFHESVPDEFLEKVFVVMAAGYWHTYLVLTKRPERAAEFFRRAKRTPLSHVWLGTTAGMQQTANERWSAMGWLAQQGWKTWVSCEPKLEQIDWHGWSFLKWMVTGGESGPYARPMAPAWVRADRDWCQERGVAFWFKQWGEWSPEIPKVYPSHYAMTTLGKEILFRYGRKLAGRTLDGRTWEEFPEVNQ